nr:uncharacterized protein LOC113739292 [Coffea arabica]
MESEEARQTGESGACMRLVQMSSKPNSCHQVCLVALLMMNCQRWKSGGEFLIFVSRMDFGKDLTGWKELLLLNQIFKLKMMTCCFHPNQNRELLGLKLLWSPLWTIMLLVLPTISMMPWFSMIFWQKIFPRT